MVSRVYWRRSVPRSLSSQRVLRTVNARQTCSIVTSGFFPPQLGGLLGGEGQGQLAQRQVPQQRPIVLSLIVPKAEFALADPETVFHVPAAKADPQQRPHRRGRRGVGQEVFLLARGLVPRPH